MEIISAVLGGSELLECHMTCFGVYIFIKVKSKKDTYYFISVLCKKGAIILACRKDTKFSSSKLDT